ncbi:MAG: histidine--tRNA ligase [Burkholderiaceae bacterium]
MTDKNQAAKLQAVKGMNDLLLDEAPLWEWFEDTVRDVFRQYGYKLVRTPIVEPTGLFVRSIGEVTDIVEKEMYSFEDRLNGDALTLRPEITAGIVRSAIEHNWLYNGPQRVWSVGPVFRHERPQKGRQRQFHQFDVEALGFEGPDVDAEQIVMLARIWKRLGLANVQLEINSIGDAAERKAHREKLIAHFEAYQELLDEDARRRLHTNPLRILDTKNPKMQAMVDAAPKLLDLLGEASLKHFDGLKSLLTEAGLHFTVNPRLVRGLDYYNRTVFEWVTTALGAPLTITGGGRYDGLFEQLGGKPTPGIGFGMGIERVILALQEALGQSAAAGAAHVPDVYVVHADADAVARKVAEALRDAGKYAVLHAGGGSFKSQMKKADASGARYAVIIGSDEVAKGGVTLKPLRVQQEHAQEQKFVALADLAGALD